MAKQEEKKVEQMEVDSLEEIKAALAGVKGVVVITPGDMEKPEMDKLGRLNFLKAQLRSVQKGMDGEIGDLAAALLEPAAQAIEDAKFAEGGSEVVENAVKLLSPEEREALVASNRERAGTKLKELQAGKKKAAEERTKALEKSRKAG